MEDQNKKPNEGGDSRRGGQGGGGRRGGRFPKRENSGEKEYDQMIVDLARVTRVTKGGKQMSFRATVVIGDRKGKVGYGVAKGKDVQMAVDKAVRLGKKDIFTVPLNKVKSIRHRVEAKFGAAKVLINPAPSGSGLICGGAVRIVLDFAGVENASSKSLGSSNKINVIKATFAALEQLKSIR